MPNNSSGINKSSIGAKGIDLSPEKVELIMYL